MKTNLVFICGFPSSGTDLLKNIVNAHPDIFISGEFPLLPSLAEKWDSEVSRPDLDGVVENLRGIDVYSNFKNSNFPVVDQADKISLREIYAHMLTSEPVRWTGNKTPQNTENVDKLNKLFPEARYILIVRDIRDVALSWQKKWGKDGLLCAYKWNHRMQKGLQLLERHLEPRSYLTIKYEDLLSDLEGSSKQICDFLNIPFDEAMLKFQDSVETVFDGKLNYGKPILAGNSGKWVSGLSEAKAKRIEEIAFDSLHRFGYPITYAQQSREIGFLEKYLGFARDIYALLFIGNRAVTKNKFRSRLRSIRVQMRKLFQNAAA